MRPCHISRKKTFHLLCDDATACGVKMIITNAVPELGLIGWDGSAFTFRLTVEPKRATCRHCRSAISLNDKEVR